MATYNVHGGHSLNCRGASGLLDEVNEDRKVKNKVIELLRAKGHTVYDCTDDGGTTPIKNLKNIVSKCNVHKVDLDVSIHLNAGGGHGCEVYGYSDKMSSVGARVSANIASALGITNRGFKVRTNLYVLHRTNSPAILIECCFVDSATDKARWNVDKCAHAIADAIIGNRAASAPQPKPSENENVRKAQNFANDFVDAGLKVDGKIGPNTKKAMIKVLQKCLNIDYKKNLVIDGIPGKHTYDALGNHYVKRGEKQYLVTFVECALSALGYDVLGIETPGIFGAGLEYAVKKVQEKRGLKADGVADHDTLRSVISMLS